MLLRAGRSKRRRRTRRNFAADAKAKSYENFVNIIFSKKRAKERSESIVV